MAVLWATPQQLHGIIKTTETFENPNLTVAGVMGWLTGQRHKPIGNQQLKVTVYFNHDC